MLPFPEFDPRKSAKSAASPCLTINPAMAVTVRSFAKINLGLRIGAVRPDGFHELRTVYQTIALHDLIRVSVVRGSGVEIRCADERVPKDESNTCYGIVERAMAALGGRGRVVVAIDKELPVQGGLGGASGNAVSALLGLELALKKSFSSAQRLEIAAEVGSDLPLFLVGGTVLGVGRGEEVYPLPDLPECICVVAMPAIGVSTPRAFKDWDAAAPAAKTVTLGAERGAEAALYPASLGARTAKPMSSRERASPRSKALRSKVSTLSSGASAELTLPGSSDRINEFGRLVSGWLSGMSQFKAGKASSGVPGSRGRGRAGNPLLDLVRTGIENDFEQVVFPKYPELREVKRVLQAAGAFHASLSGSGSALYGLFESAAAAQKAVERLGKNAIPAVVTRTLRRQQYWKRIFDC